MAEYIANGVQTVNSGDTVRLRASIPCTSGYVIHEDGTGVFILRGITCNRFARYKVTFCGNVAEPLLTETTEPIEVGIAVNGEVKPSSVAIFDPRAGGVFGNVTSTAIITVPKCCCFNMAVRIRTADDTIPVEVSNANLIIDRIA